jgi:predicted metal-dependent phosphoesterase TrpH
MMKMDFHIHSQYSDDAIGSPKEIVQYVKKRGLQGMAITDHNTIKGGLAAQKFSSDSFLIIPGIEISTSDGHLLALNMTQDIPRNLPLKETVEHILDKGGTPVIPHIYRTMSGVKEEKLKSVKNEIKALEVYNGCSQPKTNLKTANLAKRYSLGGTGGSDSHDPRYAGYSYTLIDTTDLSIDTVMTEIEKKRTWGEGQTVPLSYRRDRMVNSLKQFFQRGFKRI